MTQEKMNPSEMARKMLEWEKLQRQADALAAEIEATVLEIRQTQTVGNVRVTYSAGRRTFDYKTAAQRVQRKVIAAHTVTKIITDWRAVCQTAEITDVPYTQAPPSAKIKLLKSK